MNALIGKTPFYRLLLPVITGIAASSFFDISTSATLRLSMSGLVVMLLSFLVKQENNFKFRWLFGAGLFIFLFSLATIQYREQEQRVRFTFPEREQSYVATILDIPKVKPRSIACHVKTAPPFEKKVIVYLEQTHEARLLIPGDEILFHARLLPFQNFGNPDDFDYVRYMHIKGFSASGYIPAENWLKTGRASYTVPILAQRIRGKALALFRSYLADEDAYAFIAAITLGYKAYLSDDLQEAFRASGTAHVLAVSGLHVGIIYLIINLLFSFLGKTGNLFMLRQWLVLLLLWGYVFMTGMSASVIRAAIMITIFCLGSIQHQRGFTYNTLAASAFLILIFRPMSLFDVSFQMSFGAVFAILFFQPKMQSLYNPQNRVMKYIWDLFTVSTAAQLGVFPLTLYYFGTFPTYFFITNLLVVPIAGIILYATVPLTVLGIFGIHQTGLIGLLQDVFRTIVQILTTFILRIVYISESLPLARLTGSHLSFFQLVLLLLLVFLVTVFLYSHRPRYLIISLALILMVQLTVTHERLTKPPPQLVIFNSPGTSEIGLFDHHTRYPTVVPENGFLPHPGKSILRLSDDSLSGFYAEERFPIDILILSRCREFKIKQILGLINPSVIVLDSSLPRFTVNKVVRECDQSGIRVHDVTQNGAYSVIF